MKIFLDDVRDPPDDTWILVRSYIEFIDVVRNFGGDITEISFDHDLGLDAHSSLAPTGMDAAKFFINKAMVEEECGKSLEKVNVHSSNPPGRNNIIGYFNSAKKNGLLNPNVVVY